MWLLNVWRIKVESLFLPCIHNKEVFCHFPLFGWGIQECWRIKLGHSVFTGIPSRLYSGSLSFLGIFTCHFFNPPSPSQVWHWQIGWIWLKPPQRWVSPELEFLSSLMWAMGTECGSSERAASPLKHEAISPGPIPVIPLVRVFLCDSEGLTSWSSCLSSSVLASASYFLLII